MKNKSIKYSVLDITLIAMFTAILTICSWMSIQVGVIPVTLQTFAIFLIFGLLGSKRGTMVVLVYILLGLCGVPVFSGFGSTAKLIGPTGGYIIGFIFMGLIIWLGEFLFRKSNKHIRFVGNILFEIIGLLVCYAFGTTWFMIVMNGKGNPYTLGAALGACVVPFLIPDLVKLVVSEILVIKLKQFVPKSYVDYKKELIEVEKKEGLQA